LKKLEDEERAAKLDPKSPAFDELKRSFRAMVKMFNSVAANVQRSSVEVANLLLRKPNRFTTAKFSNLMLGQFLRYADRCTDTQPEQQPLFDLELKEAQERFLHNVKQNEVEDVHETEGDEISLHQGEWECQRFDYTMRSGFPPLSEETVDGRKRSKEELQTEDL